MEISAGFKPNAKLERYLDELNSLLAATEIEAIARKGTAPKYPVIFIVGAPGSGGTLLMQWLASTGLFSYPSNLIARFYKAPYLGAKIQRMLTDPELAFREEVMLPGADNEEFFSSDLGQTRGLFAPNEFKAFWKYVFGVDEDNCHKTDAKAIVDKPYVLSELAAFESVLNRPLVFKAGALNPHISFLNALLPNAIFLFLKRHPYFTAQSIYQARERMFGDASRWSFYKIPQYARLATQTAFKQVAGQVYYTNKLIEEQLQQLPAARRLDIDYDDFCI
ncbi:MAG TPA: hypothetical protein ENJ15_00820, partial [Caldithrix abyssi]|nr:hypothetical protein [Caldithrix abyssi]